MDMVTAADVRAALETTLQTWMPWTLAEVCEHAGLARDALPAPDPGSYYELHDAAELDRVSPEDVRVATVVPSVTFSGVGRDQRAQWTTVINLICHDADHAATIRRSDLYRTAICIVLHQHQDLGGLAGLTEVTRASYRPVGTSGRLLLANVVEATVITDHATPLHGAPDTPPDDPSVPTPALPETTSVDVWVDRDRLTP